MKLRRHSKIQAGKAITKIETRLLYVILNGLGGMMQLSELRKKFRDKILVIADECHIATIKVFGSTVRGDARDDSDVDLLISLKKDAGLLDVGRFKWKLEDLLNRKVDVAFESHIHHAIAPQIMKEARSL